MTLYFVHFIFSLTVFIGYFSISSKISEYMWKIWNTHTHIRSCCIKTYSFVGMGNFTKTYVTDDNDVIFSIGFFIPTFYDMYTMISYLCHTDNSNGILGTNLFSWVYQQTPSHIHFHCWLWNLWFLYNLVVKVFWCYQCFLIILFPENIWPQIDALFYSLGILLRSTYYMSGSFLFYIKQFRIFIQVIYCNELISCAWSINFHLTISG